MMDATTYVELGWRLVPIPKGSKAPTGSGWNKPTRLVSTPEQAARLNGYNIGLAHVESGTCCLDIDDYEKAEAWAEERGVNLPALLCADDAVQIISGKPGRAKLLYRLPECVDWLPTMKEADGGLELRCATSVGKSVQDVLPPSIHPDTGQPYQWRGDPRKLPILPDNILSIWLEAAARRAKPAQRPQSADNGVIGRFNTNVHPSIVLERNGYQSAPGGRWLAPNSTTGLAGVILYNDGNVPRVYSNHSDPLNDGHSHDAFSVMTILEQGGNITEAIKAASRELGIDRPAEGVQPVDLFGTFEPPPFDTRLLPPQLGRLAADQAMLIGCDPGIIGMTGLGVLAGAIDDRITIQPKRHDPTWTESARLWVGVIGNPSTKKTPGMAKALAPMRAAAADLRREHQRAVQEWNDACEGLKKGDKKPPYPHCKRLTVSDTTVEKLSDILGHPEAEPRGILAVYDELNGHLASMDCYKAGAGKDRAKWLEAYNGGSMEIDRVQKGSTWVENWSVSIVGGIQPEVIHSYANATSHDGMLQRFILFEAGPATAGVDQYPDMDAKRDYGELIRALIDLAPDDAPVRLSEAAHAIREAYAAKILKAAQNMPNKPLAAMLGKWEGTFARVLLIFHVCECIDAKVYPNTQLVSGETAQRAADLMLHILLPHAIRFYEGLDPTQDNAKTLAGLVLARKWTRFTVKRDVAQNMLAYRGMKHWERAEMLDRLEGYGWIAPEPDKVNEHGRPVVYTVNPLVHELFERQAERERARRAEVAQMLNELKGRNVEDVAHARERVGVKDGK